MLPVNLEQQGATLLVISAAVFKNTGKTRFSIIQHAREWLGTLFLPSLVIALYTPSAPALFSCIDRPLYSSVSSLPRRCIAAALVRYLAQR